MIHHVVLFRFAPDTTPSQIAAARDALHALNGVIPDVRDIAFGANLADSSAEYSHCLLVVLDDMAAVQRYVDHPAHVSAVQAFLGPIREARLAVDFEAAR
jgi:hypothetical protein